MRYRYRNDEELKDSGVEWIGKIPKDWELKYLKYIIENNDGGTWGEEQKYNNDDIIVIRSTEVDEEGKWRIDNPAIRNINEKEKQRCILVKGDLLITKSSGSEKHIGKTAIVTSEIENMECVFSNFMQRIRVKSVNSSKLLFYIMNSNISKLQINYLSTTTTGLANINSELINRIKIPTTTLFEQEKIANFLDEKTSQFNLIISKKEKLIERLEEAKKSLISEVVTGKVKVVKTDDGYELVKRSSEEMKDSGVEYIGNIYKNLEIMKFRRCVTLKQGLQIAQENRFYEDGENRYKYITIKYLNSKKEDIDTEFIENPSEGVICNKQDVLLARTGATGKVVTDVEGVYHNNFFKIIYDKSKLTRDYLVFYLKQELIQKQLQLVAGTTTIPDLNHGAFLDTKIIVPLIEEQNDICNCLKVNIKYIDVLIDKTKLQITKLRDAKQSLISEAVTGKIEILD